jgi:predicted transcriptional regulator
MKLREGVRPQYPDIQAYFKATGERQQDFAVRVGLPQGYISKVAGGRCIPKKGSIRTRIAQAAQIPEESFRLLNLRHRYTLALKSRVEMAALEQVIFEAVQ